MRKILLSTALSLFSFAAANSADAAGFYIQEQSASGMGAAFAGQVAMPRDASTIYFNPAGMTDLQKAQLNAALHMIYPHAKLRDTGTAVNNAGVAFSFAPGSGPVGSDDGGNPGSWTPVPNGYIAVPVTDDKDLWVGLGVSAPFGLGSDYHDGYFARFDSTESKLKTTDIQVAVAYKVSEHLSVGAAVIAEHADANLKSIAAVPVANGAPPPAFFVGERESILKGTDWSFGANVGAMIKPTESTTIGVDYRTKIKHELDGKVILDGVFEEDGSAGLELPDIANIGVAHKMSSRLTALAQATWFGWDSFYTIAPERDDGVPLPEVVQDYQNTWAFSVGAEYDVSDSWTLRSGYQFDETPTTDEFRTTRTPDGDRHWFAAGTTVDLNDKLSVDLSTAYINIEGETIDVQRGVGADIVNVKADVEDSWVGIVSMGVNYKF